MITVDQRQVSVKEDGSGPAVLFVHGSMSNSGAWRPILKALPDGFRTVAPDLWGYGGSDGWEEDWPIDMTPDARLVEGVIEEIGEPVHLVGHSHGGTVALAAAIRNTAAVRSLILIEATPFELLHRCGEDSLYAELRDTFEGYFEAHAAGEPDAVRRVVDYWDGAGAYDRMPEKVRTFLSDAMEMNITNIKCAFGFDPDMEAYRAIETPALTLFGTQTASSSAAMTRGLTSLLPNVVEEAINGAGHFLVNTHASEIAPILSRWVRQHA